MRGQQPRPEQERVPVLVQLAVQGRSSPGGGQKPVLNRHPQPPQAEWRGRILSRQQGPVPPISGRAGRGRWKGRSARTCLSPPPQFRTFGRDPAEWGRRMRPPGGCPWRTWSQKGHGDGRVYPGKSKISPLGAGEISCRIRTSGLSGLPCRTPQDVQLLGQASPQDAQGHHQWVFRPRQGNKGFMDRRRGLARRSHAYPTKVCCPSM